jgi:hypothetical protein
MFDGTPAHLIGNVLEDCQWLFEGAAGVTLGFLTALCREDEELKSRLARQLGLFDVPSTVESASF